MKAEMKKILAGILLLLSLSAACAGGSLFRPTPLIGRDRLVYRITDPKESIVYYTRNVWFDGDSYRFKDVYGRELTIAKNGGVTIDVMGASDYYNTPYEYYQTQPPAADAAQ